MMSTYRNLLSACLYGGDRRSDRTGTGTRSLFGRRFTHPIASQGFPLITEKRVHWKSVVAELCWMLRGRTDLAYLHEHGVTIWDEWATDGDLGPVYGAQWRRWKGPNGVEYDQIAALIAGLRSDPMSRRHVMSAWNVADLDRMSLPPCHALVQFHARSWGNVTMLDCHVYQRSADVFLGVPFNIASYAALTTAIATTVGMQPAKLTISFGDLHLYENHVAQAHELLTREPQPCPTMTFTGSLDDPDSVEPEHFVLTGYAPHPPIKAPVAV